MGAAKNEAIAKGIFDRENEYLDSFMCQLQSEEVIYSTVENDEELVPF